MSDRTRGFEDGLELSLAAINNSKSLKEAKRKVEDYLSLIKERKFDQIDRELGKLFG